MNVSDTQRGESSTASRDIEGPEQSDQETSRQHDNDGSESPVIAIVIPLEQQADELPEDLMNEIQISEDRIMEALDQAKIDFDEIGKALREENNHHSKIRGQICLEAYNAIDVIKETVNECGNISTIKSPNIMPMIVSRAALEFVGMRCAQKIEAGLLVVANFILD